MPKWEKMTVGDLCDTISNSYRGDDKEVVLINTSDVLEGKVLNHQVVENKNLKGQFKKTFKENDILYSEIRPANKRYAFVDFSDTDNYIASTKLMVLRPRMDVIRPRFLFSFLSSKSVLEELQQLAETRSGTFPQITFSSELAPTPINVPDLETQDRIVGILGVIERKISMNAEINKNLEQQAQAIFKAWFVDFEPFNEEMPSDWIIGTVDDLGTEIICGKTPLTKKKEYYGGNTPFITIPDMHGCVYNVSTERYLSAAGVALQPKKTLPPNTVCVSCIGTAGLVNLVSEKSQSNQQINSIVPKEGISAYYIYLLMQTLSETINKLGQSGSTIVNLNKTQFGKIQVAIPSEQVLCNFDTLCKPLFEMILSNQKENIELANLRDALLPKLMSGELDVSDIDL
ncbi:MAG: restriction endonuclease subunit S [Veillonella sp.]|mgnify:FL=1|uniref:restriction endonuclease subunit S n=2 Tax=Veillonella sp. TaxID=1926307 RepID=UPI0028FFC915|nr:restriction endonuclease subunit S [Veillonella sp.]MDU2334497.1 restriction endonuclease subunit S [Veillonella sp.]MDU2347264.1 restriction endonuclease subunit S [Veillonella sp.]